MYTAQAWVDKQRGAHYTIINTYEWALVTPGAGVIRLGHRGDHQLILHC